MRFFSKFVFICNICFLISLALRLVEQHVTNKEAVIPMPWLEGLIVILGFIIAIIVNAVFVFIILYRKSIRKPVPVHWFIILFNLLMFPVEIWQQFFLRY